MTRMARGAVIAVIGILLIAAAGGIGFWLGQRHGAGGEAGEEAANTEAAADEEVKPIADVLTAPARRATITERITAYGTVVAPGGDVGIVSVPFESRIVRVLVAAGQQIASGTELAQLESSPDALMQLQESKNAAAAADVELHRVQQQFNEHLATNVELGAAQQADESAKLKLSSLIQRGVGQSLTTRSDTAGIVSKIDVQQGQIVPAGGPLVEIALGNRIEVSLGVEPADAARLKIGEPVKLQAVGSASGKPIAGTIRLIAGQIDPTTRLAEVRVALPATAHLMLDTYVSGEIEQESADAIVVPRSALVPEEEPGAFALFTVRDAHAVRHAVKVGIENDQASQLIGGDVRAGDLVVIQGSHELEDGMAVAARAAPATQSDQREQPAPAASQESAP